MTFNQMLTKLIEADLGYEFEDTVYEKPYNHFNKGRILKEGREFYSVKWEVGGSTGGNCWNGQSKRYSVSTPEPDFEIFDQVLELFCPNLTFLQYKKLTRVVLLKDTELDREWYGNYTEYGVKKVYLDDLHKYLEKEGLLDVQE